MEKYVIDRVIGEGTYGIVYRAKEKGTNDDVAIKKFKTVGDEQLSKREIQAISMLSHPYIVSYRNSFRHEGLLHLVFDYVPDSMNKVLNRNRRGVKPALAQRLIFQLCQALEYCHSSRIIHRDVKPDNILIDDKGDIRLCDFGVARPIQFEGDPLSDYVATRWYRPPEQELRMDRYSFDADIWSVGCVLMELLTGRPLFPGNTQIDQINLIQEYLGPLPPTLAARLPRGVTAVKKPTKSFEELLGDRVLPDGTIDFLAQTMQLEPRNRLTAASCLGHAFLRPLRDADQRERKHRQLQEKQQRQSKHSATDAQDTDDGIEEEIPGGGGRAEAKTPLGTPNYRGGPRPFDFKVKDSKDSKDANIATVSTPNAKTQRRHVRESKAPGKHGDSNPADMESDDIQEIIEMDELSVAEPVSPRQGKRHGDETPMPRTKPARRRRESNDNSTEHALDHHECYEDDFEEYQ